MTTFNLRQKDFNDFNESNPLLWKYFERFTLEAINQGHRKISHWLIINRIRWEVTMSTTSEDFKISNNYIAFYARLFIKTYPQYSFIFNLKRMTDEPLSENNT